MTDHFLFQSASNGITVKLKMCNILTAIQKLFFLKTRAILKVNLI